MNSLLIPSTSSPRVVRRSALSRPPAAPGVLVDVPTPVPPVVAPTMTEIAELAYALFVARGGEHGHDIEDWLEAERSLTAARPAAPPPDGGGAHA